MNLKECVKSFTFTACEKVWRHFDEKTHISATSSFKNNLELKRDANNLILLNAVQDITKFDVMKTESIFMLWGIIIPNLLNIDQEKSFPSDSQT